MTIGRRECVLGGTAAVLALKAQFVGAAKSSKVYRIGVLDPNPEMFANEWKEFVGELYRLGYREGDNISFERRFGNALEEGTIARYAAELVSLRVDLIYATHGTLTAAAAKSATQSIPIVFYSSGDPVGYGLVASLSRPGGNITGNSTASRESETKSLQLLAELVPRLRRVVELLPLGTRSLAYFSGLASALTTTSKRLGLEYDYLDVASMTEVQQAIERLARERGVALTLSYSDWVVPHLKRIAQMLVDYGMPSIGDPDEGFLLQYAAGSMDLARKSAEYVDRILRGADPGELPVQQPSVFDLVINQKTARALNLAIPEALLIRASRVVDD